MAVMALVGEGLCTRRVTVRARDVVYVKGIFEASEGLAAMFAESGGELVIAVHPSRLAELDEVLADLAREIGALVESPTTG
ncbi:MAG: DUF4911 domain-containing protein [Polyangiaceae bacterium]